MHIEVEGPGDEIELPSAAKTTVTWHYRRSATAFGAELTDAARDAVIADGTRIWVACDAATMRGIRRHFTRERGLPVSSLVTRGYWLSARPTTPTTTTARTSSPVYYWPTWPSIRSRSRSAWPQWRAYSSIMCTSTSRRGSSCRRAWCPGPQVRSRDVALRVADLVAPGGPRLGDHHRIRDSRQ